MWSQDQAYRNLGMALGGLARRWFLSLSPRPNTLQQLKTELLAALKPQNYELEVDFRLRCRVKQEGESAINYCFDVIYLCSKVDPNMPEPIEVQHLMRGLPSLLVKVFPFLPLNADPKEFIRQIQVQCQASQLACHYSLLQTNLVPLFNIMRSISQPSPTALIVQVPPVPTLVAVPSASSLEE